MGTFKTEGRRIVRYLLLTLAAQQLFERLSPSLTRAILFSGSPQTDLWMTLLVYCYPLVITAVCTLINRYFTFHASKKWYIAVLLMMLATVLWNILGNIIIMIRSSSGEVISGAGYMEELLWLTVSYLLQRCVIYRHTLDTNNWYDHSRLTQEASDEGVTPDE